MFDGTSDLNQCWEIISEVWWYSSEGNSTGNVQVIYPWYDIKMTVLRLQPSSHDQLVQDCPACSTGNSTNTESITIWCGTIYIRESDTKWIILSGTVMFQMTVDWPACKTKSSVWTKFDIFTNHFLFPYRELWKLPIVFRYYLTPTVHVRIEWQGQFIPVMTIQPP